MAGNKSTLPILPSAAAEGGALSASPAAADLGSQSFPIVGIGASAGGLAAIEAFFSGMPADKDPDMAFVLVQHLAPDHKSLLTELIRRYTRMQASEVTDGVVVQPNRVYIIPPNHDLALINGTLQLLEPSSPRGQRLPIDFFFRSLAQDQHERAICIVLSGTGSDGTLGVRAVKGEGGLVIAQDLESSEYDGMPRNVINTGLADFVLPPVDMPAHLIAYVSRAFGQRAYPLPQELPKAEDALKKVFILLRSQTGHDFSQYKYNTIRRRIERRMAVNQIDSLGEYVRYLQQKSCEVEALFRDLLIGVTSFFRDPEAFAELETKGIPRLFAGKVPGETIRIWICGCSTGEEAYSIAILLQEQMDRLQQHYQLQIFATDIDSRAISVARSGLYPVSIAADVRPERLTRFFTLDTEGGTYRINKSIRDILIFSEQDVIKDPPFSKLDLISCRNLMIYLNSDLQKKLIPLFHYALNPGGMLFLGTSETIGEFAHLFTIQERQSKLYLRVDDVSHTQRLPLSRFCPPIDEGGHKPKHMPQAEGKAKISLRETTERLLLEHYAPVSVLINDRGDMLYIHGNTGRYLQLTSGEPGVNILNLAREGLKRDLALALQSAIKDKQAVERPGLRVKSNGDYSHVNLTVLPVPPSLGAMPGVALFLVVMEQCLPAQHLPPDSLGTCPTEVALQAADADVEFEGLSASALIASLKQELRIKEEYLKSATEELETSNEELKSSNEEMQSVNEELQSTNEELETSKEELQSVNEELATVNTELQTKVLDLSRANNDMNNLLAGTGVGTIFVDFQLRVQRFTPPVTQLINLIPGDVGRPVGHIVSNLVGYDTLVDDITAVLENLIPKECEVQTKEGTWFLLRIRPYRTLENVIEGAVITFYDINEIKRTREALQKANEQLRLAAVVARDSHDAIVLQDLEGRILVWNPAAERMYGWSESEALQMGISELIPEPLRDEALKRVQQLSRKDVLEPYHTQRIAKDGIPVAVWLTATALVDDAGKVYAIATTERAGGIEDL